MQRKITVLVASLVLLWSLWSIVHRLWWSVPSFPSKPVQELGRELADETAKAIQDHGRLVAVIDAAHQLPGQPDLEEWEAFQKELAQHRSVSLVATEVVSPDPNDMIPDAGCSRYQLKAILEKYADADAIVFFFSLPEWGFVEAILPPHITPKILVADRTVVGTKTQYGGYFDQGILAVLIARRTGSAPPSTSAATTGLDSFDNHFQIITPQNYQSLLN